MILLNIYMYMDVYVLVTPKIMMIINSYEIYRNRFLSILKDIHFIFSNKSDFCALWCGMMKWVWKQQQMATTTTANDHHKILWMLGNGKIDDVSKYDETVFNGGPGCCSSRPEWIWDQILNAKHRVSICLSCYITPIMISRSDRRLSGPLRAFSEVVVYISGEF